MSFKEPKIFLLLDAIAARLNASIWRACLAGRQGWKFQLLFKFAGRMPSARKHGPHAARVPGINWFECPDPVGAIQTLNKCDYGLATEAKPIGRTLVMHPDRAMRQYRIISPIKLQTIV